MRYYFLLSVLFALFSVGLNAQNYQPFSKNSYVYRFGNTDNCYKLAIDSVSANANGDSVFYFNPIAHETRERIGEPPCHYEPVNYVINNNNIFGREIVKRVNNEYLFLVFEDTFLIKTAGDTNTSWLFSQKQNITARIKSRTFENVFEEKDSVLTIELSNKYQFKISKNYGLTQGFILLRNPFKDLDEDIVRTLPKQYLHLISIPSIKKGLKYPEFIDFFNFEPGDKFGYEGIGEYSITHRTEDFTIKRITGKSVSNDSTSVTIDYTTHNLEYYYNFPKADTTISKKAGKHTYYKENYPFLKGNSLQFLFTNKQFDYGSLLKMISCNQERKLFGLHFEDFRFYDCDQTLSRGYHSLCYESYTQRLGKTIRGCCCNYDNRLVCYSLNDSTINSGKCPQVDKLTSIIELPEQESVIEISPNPANNYISIKVSYIRNKSRKVKITDLQGKIVYQELFHFQDTENQINIDISMFPAGLYFLNQDTENGNFSSRKFIISR